MSFLAVVIYLALLGLTGYGLLAVIGGTRRHRAPALVGFCLGLGCCFCGLVLFLISLLGAPPSVPVMLVPAAAGIGMIIIARKRLPFATLSCRCGAGQTAATLSLMLLALAAFGMATAYAVRHVNIEWDSFMLWGFKARVVSAAPVRDATYFHNPSYTSLHLNYPLLVPFLMSTLHVLSGEMGEVLPKTVFLVAYVVWGLIVYAGVRDQIKGPAAAAVTVLAFMGSAMVRRAGSGHVDVLLSALYAGVLVSLLRWLRTWSKHDAVFAGVFAAGAAFTKNEGLALLAVSVSVGLLFAAVHRHRRKALAGWVVFVIVALALIAPWLIFRHGLPRLDENYPTHLTVTTLLQNLNRLPGVLSDFCREYFLRAKLNGLAILLVLFALATSHGFKRRQIGFLWVTFLAHLGLYCLVYVVGPSDPTELMKTSVERLSIHPIPAMAILVAAHWRLLMAACYLRHRADRLLAVPDQATG